MEYGMDDQPILPKPVEPDFYEVDQFDVNRSFVRWEGRTWLSPIGTIRAGDVGIRFFRVPTADILEAEPRQEFIDRIDRDTRERGIR